MKRLTIQFPEKITEILDDLAKDEQVPKTEIIRRSIALYNYIRQEGVKKNNDLVLMDQQGNTVKNIVFTT